MTKEQIVEALNNISILRQVLNNSSLSERAREIYNKKVLEYENKLRKHKLELLDND